ncbi:MAG: PQQ-binding-like beta-propeller repeat protein [Eubacteriales bacterium]
MRKIRALAVIAAVVLVGTVFVYYGINYIQSAKANSDHTAGTQTALTTVPKADSTAATPGPSLSPTSPPVADPTPLPPKNPEDLKMSWLTPAVFDGANAFSEQKMTMTQADGKAVDYWIFKGRQAVSGYQTNDPISFGEPADYTSIEGVLAFRGNNYRNAPSWGSANVSEKKLEIVWTKDIGAVSSTDSYWPGSGWTGQPLLVHWPEATRMAMNISSEMKQKDLVEVIYPVFDGNIYFLDLDTGKETRKPISVGFTFKGTGIIDPRGYPILYCGQGLNENGGTYGEFNYHIFNLLDQTEMYSLYGRDELAFRKWGAWDSSGLIDAKTDSFIECAENGMVYLTKLNTQYDEAAGKLSIAPQITRYRYHTNFTDELGIESSPAAYRNFLYFSDNGGAVQCLDLNTLKPVWIYNAEDDSDCTITLEDSAAGVSLYTANEIDKRSAVSKVGANCNIRKLNALTGELIWQYDVPCVYHFYLNGGALATPLVGQDDISDLIIFNVCLTSSESDGKLIALDKGTGKLVWERDLAAYSWSSPVPVKGDDGKTYAVFCDSAGNMHLFDPKTGKDLDVISLGANVESSPSVYNDMIVVGSYAKKIFGIKVK